ncbi:hypothetical protein EDB87DRAFT_1574387 [Lactarius vividus]|nr:hypothetical protein EDB87DRAFT_1581103 [Lactarius vividus]KAH9065986.1 hypothetical protein EDB87DRAFT_1574387 [Lactarius vividus]
MFGQKPSMGSTKIAESQGSQSQPISVGLTVIRARNIPHIKTTLGRKREFFVTIAYGGTTKKTKKQTEKRTKSVHIDGQTAVWDQELDAFHLRLILCLYAKRLTKRTISHLDVSVTLGDGNGQAGQSTPPVTLDLTITVSGKTGRTWPQDRGEMSLVERARIDLDRADEVDKSIDQSKTWEGVVGKIKWVMDTLSPVAELHPIVQMAYKVLSVIPVELSKQYQRDNNVRTLLKSMHDAFDFANHEDTLKSIKPKSKQADVLLSCCGMSVFAVTSSSRISTISILDADGEEYVAGGVEEKIQALSTLCRESKSFSIKPSSPQR